MLIHREDLSFVLHIPGNSLDLSFFYCTKLLEPALTGFCTPTFADIVVSFCLSVCTDVHPAVG